MVASRKHELGFVLVLERCGVATQVMLCTTLVLCVQGLFSYEVFFLNGTLFDSSCVLRPDNVLLLKYATRVVQY